MIRLSQQDQFSTALEEENETSHHRPNHPESGRIIETDYFCGCRSHDPHAPDRCQIHGDAIRLTRIIGAETPRVI